MNARLLSPLGRAAIPLGLAALTSVPAETRADEPNGARPPGAVEPGPVDPKSLGLTLVWNAPADCPQETELVASVQAILGPAQDGARAVRAEATVEATPVGTYRVVMTTEVDGAKGERTLEAESCRAATQATAVILAIMINPRSALAPKEPPPEPPKPPPPAKVTAPPKAEPKVPTLGAAGAAVVLDVGSLPHVTGGGNLWLALTPAGFRFELFGEVSLPADATSSDVPGAGASFLLVSAGVGAAHLWRIGPVGLGPALGASLDYVSATGFGGDEALDTGAWWVSPFTGLAADVRLQRWLSLRLDATVKVPTRHASFVVANREGESTGLVHELSPVTGNFRLGIGFHFP